MRMPRQFDGAIPQAGGGELKIDDLWKSLRSAIF